MNCEHLRISNSTNFLFLLSHVKSGRILFLSTLAESRTARFNTNKAARILTLTLIRHFSANGCLLPLCAVDGMAVTTVEGIGSTNTALHPVQVNTVSMGRYDQNSHQQGFKVFLHDRTHGFMLSSSYQLKHHEPQPSNAKSILQYIPTITISFVPTLLRSYRSISVQIAGYSTDLLSTIKMSQFRLAKCDLYLVSQLCKRGMMLRHGLLVIC